MEKSFFGDEFQSRNIDCIFVIEIIFQPIIGWFSINENFFFVATEEILM